MNRVSKVIITIVIVAVLAAIGWFVLQSMNSSSEPTEPSGNNQNDETGNGADQAANQEVALTITYNGTEFMPSAASAKVGDVIEVVNDSTNLMDFASDDHPTHLDNSEFNVGDIEPGERATFTVTAPGTWGYHDHYNATAYGELIVE